jgi:hypothetical protein
MRIKAELEPKSEDEKAVIADVRAIMDRLHATLLDTPGFEQNRVMSIIESAENRFKMRITKLFKAEKACFQIGGLLNWNRGDKKECAEIIEIENKRTEWILTLEGVQNGHNFSTVPREFASESGYGFGPRIASLPA